MSIGITQATIDHIKTYVHLINVDILNGHIINRSELNVGRYLVVKLKNKSIKVHHIIAIVGGLDLKEGLVINHKDGNRFNNRLDNLEVSTHSANIKHAHDTNLIKRKRGNDLSWTKLTEQQAREIKQLLKEGLTADRIRLIVGVSIHCVYHIKNGRTWNHI